MARLKSLGFELQSLTAGHEIDSSNGSTAPTINTTTFRSGAAALKINTTAGNTSYIQHQYRSASNNKVFLRAYIYITSYPVSNGTILGLVNHGNTDQGGGLELTTTGTVQLIGGSGTSFAQVGSDSAALSLNTWYRLEITFDDSNVNNTITAYVDGTQFATGNGQDMATNSTDFALGDIDAVGVTAFFDDIAVNDSSGSFQTGLPGAGKLLYFNPNAAGDVNGFSTQIGGTAGAANNYTRVNETTPNDATTLNGSATLNQADLFNVTDSGIGSGDTVNVVEVHGRFRNNVADNTATIKFEIEKTASGTISQSAAIVPNSTTWKTNATAVPTTAPLITYQDPDSAAWTQTTLDSMQIGYKLTAGPGTVGRRIDVTKVWAVVDYTPATVTTKTITGLARITATTLKTITGKARVTETTLQTILGKARIQLTTLQTVVGKTRITATTTRTITGLARATAVTTKTVLGVARIQEIVTKTIQGLSRITGVVAQMLTGKARITATTTRAILGKGDILKTTTQTILGLSRIQEVVSKTLLGLARITETTQKTLLGLSRVTATTTQIILGKGRIQETGLQTILGKANIVAITKQILLGEARITAVTIKTILGHARITATVLQTLIGKSRIQKTVSQIITGLARVTAITQQTISGKSRIVITALQSILGRLG